MQTNSITTDFQTVQTFDFQNNGTLNRTTKNLGYGIPAVSSGQGRYIGTSSTGGYQGGIIPPTNIFVKEIKKYKIRFYKPSTTTSSRGTAVAISDNTENTCIEYSRNTSAGGHLILRNNGTIISNTSVADLTGELTIEMIFENGNITVNLSNTTDTYTYNLGNYGSIFTTLWNNKDLGLHMARRADSANYIRKVEIVSK